MMVDLKVMAYFKLSLSTRNWDSAFDKRFPLSSQFENRWADFDTEYSQVYQQYPVPSGMAWAPSMDAYRAAQPKTDTDPVN